jgi:hypothetical protein
MEWAGPPSIADTGMGGNIFGSGLASEWATPSGMEWSGPPAMGADIYGGVGSEMVAGGTGGMAPGGAMGAWATPAAFAALIGAGKLIEHNNPGSWYGRAGLSLLGPSGKQVLADPADPRLLFAGPLAGFIRNDEAASAKPEWAGAFGK